MKQANYPQTRVNTQVLFQAVAAASAEVAAAVADMAEDQALLLLQNLMKCLKKLKFLLICFMKLGAGMKKLSDSTSNINVMGDISVASSKYMNTINVANDSLGKLADSYQNTARVINDTGSAYRNMTDSISVIEIGGKSYQQQLETLNKNLSALNTVYELQRKGADDHIKESETLYKGIQGLMKDLSDSAGDAKKYREQIAKLNDNLAALNNVYGNMLAAMNVK